MHTDPRFAPLHKFGDLIERVPGADRVILLDLQEKMKMRKKELGNMYHGTFDTLPTITSEEQALLKKQCSDQYMKDLHAILSKVSFALKAYCEFHDDYCYISPRSNPDFLHRNCRWTEIGGGRCCPWSSMGTHNGNLDEGTLSSLIWAYSSRYYEPDDLIHECVSSFKPHLSLDPVLTSGPSLDISFDTEEQAETIENIFTANLVRDPMSRPVTQHEDMREARVSGYGVDYGGMASEGNVILDRYISLWRTK